MNRLSIFTRFPEAGKVKTRLIPALGATKAAEAHNRLMEITLEAAAELRKMIETEIEIVYHGGSPELMESWLGKEHNFSRQVGGNLGRKLKAVIEKNLSSGGGKNIVIGSDCPQLSAEILTECFHKLNGNDLVLGPAADGGYYAIGMKKPYPPLFENISWGSSEVFKETMTIAGKMGLKVWSPPVLNDVDRPEDLKLLEGFSGSGNLDGQCR